MHASNMIKHELIGAGAEVVAAANKSLVGIKGRIVDETKHLLVIENDRERRILKSHATFKITRNNHSFTINGKLLVGRPEDRMKKRIRQ